MIAQTVIPYCPREAFLPFHNRSERWAVLVVHRRAGKTVAAINDLIKGALTCPRVSPRFAYVAPTYSQAKDVAWGYLKRFCAPLGGVVSEGELHITLPGDRRIRLYGADNFDRLRGIYLDGCVVDEPADLDPAAWTDILRPALSDRQGWCVWIGTPKGRDAFYRLWRDATGNAEWFTMRLAASASGLLPAEELASAKHSMRHSPGAYDREYECSFDTPVAGSIYGDLIAKARQDKRVCSFEWDRAAPRFSFWDIGWNDSTSIWIIQIIGRDVHWIWHTEQRQKTAAQMWELMQHNGIGVSINFLPHDADHADASEGKTYRDALIKAGMENIRMVPRCRTVGPGIDALRALIDRSWFRVPQCEQGLQMLEAYRFKPVKEGGVEVREPHHDYASHSCFVAGTRVLLDTGETLIENVREGDYVVTPWGKRKVSFAGQVGSSHETIEISVSSGERIECTQNHGIISTRGLTRADSVRLFDGVWTTNKSPKLSFLKASGISYRDAITSPLQAFAKSIAIFIARYGQVLTARFLRSITFITSTATTWTTALRIWNACLDRLTFQNTRGFRFGTLVEMQPAYCLSEQSRRARSGTHPKPERSGIQRTRPIRLESVRLSSNNASAAAKTTRLNHSTRNSVTLTANKGSGEDMFEYRQKRNVSYVAGILWTKLKIRTRGFAHRIARGSVVIGLKQKNGELQPVYDLTVDHDHCFYANGVLVSNSDAARYVAEAIDLGMVSGAAAKRIADAMPRYPDGSMVDVAHVKELRMRARGRGSVALSGPSI